jgi:4-amino-4-deoxy-L-arabinose transferase-like glycosyltransferase
VTTPVPGEFRADAADLQRETLRALLALILVTSFLRLVLAGVLGLTVDESYTVAISRSLSLSYFDHPPLHVWLVGLWARLTGSEAPLVLRLPDVAMFAVTTCLMYRLTAMLFGERAGLWAAVSLNLAPLFTINAGIGIVPDALLVLFSLLAVQCFARAMLPSPAAREDRSSLLGAGAAMGLALLSKYTVVFPLAGLLFYLLSCRPRSLGWFSLWLGAFLVLILFTPVLVWNHAHAWASFAFQGGRAAPASFSLARAAASLAAQLLYLLPWIAAAALYALARALARGRTDARTWLFACLATGPISAFSLLALWTKVLPHWAAIGWLFTFPLLGEWLASLEAQRARLLRGLAAATAAVPLALTVLIATQAATGWLDRFIPALAAHDPTLDALDWRELDTVAARLGVERRGMVVATVSWIDAGKADYALGGRVPVLCLSSDPRHFAYLHDPARFAGRDALIVAADGRPDWLTLAAPHFQHVEPGEDIVVRRRNGAAALTLHTAWGRGLEPAGSAP